MNPQEAREFVRRKVIECVPSILDLKFGCKVTPKSGHNAGISKATVIKVYEDETFDAQMEKETELGIALINLSGCKIASVEIIGRDIRLADVLVALSEVDCMHEWSISESNEGLCTIVFSKCDNRGFIENTTQAYWNLFDDSLDNQSPETWVALAEMMR